ncbi:tyrosine-type recombinase/integrase [Sphingomonas turrisvirgatae]|uniref:Tyr recombinase domain-containing protein n=1 Tax=Sphingomonas turrisvirgatae TaxID=1888892 RepID=A0A1E3LV30_9SPHN|nr:site-specific integrase [Sphingomonas turrisvirgatae]ODP37569.1 hypothetical protein BFL28_17445 [Sphingomonas turrisvirgatae]
MARLTALKVRIAAPGRHGDGDGLYLLVKPSGARSWVLRVQQEGKRRDIGLGAVELDGTAAVSARPSADIPLLLKRSLTLAEARAKARELRQFSRAGKDPIVERDRERVSIPNFKSAAVSTHAALKAGWSEKNADAFLTSLATYAYPTLGHMRVDEVEAAHVLAVLTPIWTSKPGLASKVRIRVGQVLNFSHSKGWRPTEAPSRTVSLGLPKQPKGGNFKSMPYADVPAIVREFSSKSPTAGRRAMLFQILTAARPGEVRAARWRDIEFASAEWRRPAELMKQREPHVVTLNKQAVELLETIKRDSVCVPDDLIFSRGGKPLSDMALTKLLRDAGLPFDAHGFRSSFRDWAAETMPHIPDPVAEAALAHAVSDKVVRAYKRTTFLAMRRNLLAAWGRFVAGSSDDTTTSP